MSRESIPGWDPIVWLYKEWTKQTPRSGAIVVEVGVALGRSLSWIADWCIEHGRRDIEVWAIDSWAGNAPNGEQQTMSAVAGGHLSLYAKMMMEHDPRAFEFIRPVRATSAQGSRLFEVGTVDLCVIDGDHSYAGCLTDIECWWPKVRGGGWIGGDDHHPVHHPGVIEACRQVFGADYHVESGANGWEDGRVWRKIRT